MTLASSSRRWSSTLPLRVRLVAGFVVAITVVLSAAGAFVYWRVAYALDRRLDGDLRAQARQLAPRVTGAGTLRQDAELDRVPSGRRYQLLDGRGRVLAHGDEVRATPLLPAARAQEALRREVVVDLGPLLPVSRTPLRVLAQPITGDGPARVLVVAERRDDRDEALRELLGQLLAAGVGALVVTALVGDRLARAALTPVERYRAQAASIARGASGVRLDVPAGRDDEVTRLGQTLNEVLDELEAALERERRFTQDASHELRTPLTLLSTRVQLALRRRRSVPEHEATLRELSHDLEELVALSEQLLEVSAAASGSDRPGCDLVAVATDVVDGRVAGDGPRVVLDGSDPVPTALPEPDARRLLTNLVGNAVLLHGRARAVRVVVDRVGAATARLQVSDDGAGIAADFLPTAADRFARADDARGRPGAGLGLSLVRDLVERYDGELRLCAHSTHHRCATRFAVPCTHDDRGTTVTVLLPLAGS